MRILFIADARSPIACGWIKHFINRGDDIHVISSYPCQPGTLPGATVYELPFAFSKLSGTRPGGVSEPATRSSLKKRLLSSLRRGRLYRLSTFIRFWLSPLALSIHVKRMRELIEQVRPDFVHAMRIPFEGLLARKATPAEIPLLISVWGNDFTLFATRYPLVALHTRRAMRRADALLCDCRRDLALAIKSWSFSREKLAVVLPSSGGILSSTFHSAEPAPALRERLNIPASAPVIINARGFRNYVRNDVFFKSIPQVLRESPETIFLCVAMQGNPIAENWVTELGIKESVRLLPSVPHDLMAEMFWLADIAVSPSLHDGTPNTLLEALACGCFPVAGDVESVREWIVDEVNGLLCDPNDPCALARATVRAIKDEAMRNRAREYNAAMIDERAEYGKVMRRAEEFYDQVIQQKQKVIEA